MGWRPTASCRNPVRLAVVNFTSPQACWNCFQVVRSLIGNLNISITDLQQAKHQGLQENMAACCARSPPLTYPQPMVFVAGQEISWAQACKMYVNLELLNGNPAQGNAFASSPWTQPRGPSLHQDQADFLQSISGDLLSCVRLEGGVAVVHL